MKSLRMRDAFAVTESGSSIGIVPGMVRLRTVGMKGLIIVGLLVPVLVLGCAGGGGNKAATGEATATRGDVQEENALKDGDGKEGSGISMGPKVELPRVDGRKVLMIIAPKDFRDEELKEPKQVLEARGAEVRVASTSVKEAIGMLGFRVKPDLALEDVKIADYDAVVFVGGSGASRYWTDQAAHEMARNAAAEGKVLGAICIAPVTLANAGVLKGKNSTVWPSEKDKLTKQGAKYTGNPVEVDGRIVTADGPTSARAFGEALVKALAQ